jgi:hypothetical protein
VFYAVVPVTDDGGDTAKKTLRFDLSRRTLRPLTTITRQLLKLAASVAILTVSLRAAAQGCTSPPSEARNLRLAGGASTELTWSPPIDSGGAATVVYDILRSETANGFGTAYCSGSGVAEIAGQDGIVPVGIFFYLVRAKNGCGGTLGTDSSGTPTTGTACQFENGGACLFDNECVGGGCCDGYCRDLSNDPDHCGGCGTVCSGANVATRTCGAGTCVSTCAAQFADCDGNVQTNGCECAGSSCCSGGCAPPHINGLGQSFSDCAPLGVPGNQLTYSAGMAANARAAWLPGNDFTVTCGTGGNAAFAAVRQTPFSCAVWVYQKTLAGYVHLNAASSTCFCPTAVDPTWY